jgi:hypothetical protein|nr:MAG TPA: virion structural protein [Caudoviricetes sp.]
MSGLDSGVITLQSNIKQFNKANARNYSLFLGGMNTTNKALENFDPLKLGYPRFFVVQAPKFMEATMPNATKNFKHMLETQSTSFQGIESTQLEFEPIQGGINGAQFEIPTLSKDSTNEITISLFENAGSPVREYIGSWINGISDRLSGYCTYNGAFDRPELGFETYSQAYQTMEIIYVSTDPTGRSSGIEYACLLTNMVPKLVKTDQFNWESGTVATCKYDIAFTCSKYESADINARAKELLDKFRIKQSYLEMASGYTTADIEGMEFYSNVEQGA